MSIDQHKTRSTRVQIPKAQLVANEKETQVRMSCMVECRILTRKEATGIKHVGTNLLLIEMIVNLEYI